MAEYIEREALLAEYDRLHTGEPGRARKLIAKAPAADVVEVKHGKWVWVAQRFLDGGYIDIFRCSECLVPDGKQYHYCPNCGARMDGGNE